MKKKFLGILTAFCMIVGMLPISTFAQENTVDAWDGTADTSWYDDTKTEFEISTAEQLAGLAILVNGTKAKDYNDYKTFAGKTVNLTANVDIRDHEWISIGSGANGSLHAFCGTFDGQNHTIAGLYSHEDYISGDIIKREHNAIRTGLFGAVYQGTIKNIGVIDADIFISENDTSTYGMGIIADWFTNSNMYNCYSSGSITGGSYVEKYIGGLIGFGNGNITIQECYSQATITGNYLGTCYEGEGGLEPLDCWDSLGGIIGASYTGIIKINDCWFDGKIIVNSIQAPVGGIIGYSEDGEISNCMVATTDIGDDGYGNTFWIGYEVYNTVANCIYPNDKKYSTSPGNYPDDKEISAGLAVDNFNSDIVVAKLNENASDGIKWVKGINHSTFSWDERNIAADYTKVDEAIAKANALNKANYKDFTAVDTAINSVVRNKNITEQATVDGYATAIEIAINALKYKNADYTKVDEAIAKANALNKANYKDFTAVDTAINSVVRDKNITEQATVDGYATAIGNAIIALEYKNADYTKVDEAIAKANALNKADYKDFTAVDTAINAVVRGKNITEQKDVDAMADAINNAVVALEEKPDSKTNSSENSNTESKNKSKSKNDSKTSPETGNNSHLALWIALMSASVCVVLGATAYSKKKKKHAE